MGRNQSRATEQLMTQEITSLLHQVTIFLPYCIFLVQGSQSKPGLLQLPQDLSDPQSHLGQLSEMFFGDPPPMLTSNWPEKQVKGFQCSPRAAKMPLESRSLREGLGAKRHWAQIWWYPNVLLLAAGCVCASSTSPLGFANHSLKFNWHRIEPVECQRTGLFHGAASLSGHKGENSVIHRQNPKRSALYLSSGHCKDLWGPGARLGDSPCALLCHLPATSPTKAGAQSPPLTPSSCVSFHFRYFIKATRNSVGPQVWKNLSISVDTENMGYWEISPQLHSGSAFTGFCCLGFFLETDSATKATD